MDSKISISDDRKLISCIVAKGVASTLQARLIDDWQLHPTIQHARGVGRAAPLTKRGIGEQQEKEILQVVVEADRADDLMEFIYYELELDKKPGGMIYQLSLSKANLFTLPELEAEHN